MDLVLNTQEKESLSGSRWGENGVYQEWSKSISEFDKLLIVSLRYGAQAPLWRVLMKTILSVKKPEMEALCFRKDSYCHNYDHMSFVDLEACDPESGP